MAKLKKFKRAGLTQKKDMADERGTVKVQCILVTRGTGGAKAVKGNICRSLTVANAKVSEVIKAIEDAIIE